MVVATAPSQTAIWPQREQGALQTLSLHRRPVGHAPHARLLPHPSPIVPQNVNDAPLQMIGVQSMGPGKPQTFGTPPPPHVKGGRQVPQSSLSPHPPPIRPQY
jgi:hypothetical protein